MTIEYDTGKDKDVYRMSDALKKMCTLVQDKVETSTDGIQGHIIHRKYFCPCGMVSVLSIKKPGVQKIHIASDRCGI